MVQPLINFSFDKPEDFYTFIQGLRKAGVMKFTDNGVQLDLMPAAVDNTNIEPDAEYRREEFKRSLENVMDADKSENETLFWSAGK